MSNINQLVQEAVEAEYGTNICRCPKCKYEMPHTDRGKPCSTIKCPECGTLMEGAWCRTPDK